MGRENWIMFIHGGREVMIVAFLAGLFTTAIAVVVGAVSAFMGGKVDSTLMTITDIWLTLPRFLLLVVIATMIALEDAWTLALFLAVIAILPTIALHGLGQTTSFGATSVLIMVSVALETTSQLESHMLMRHYKGFLN